MPSRSAGQHQRMRHVVAVADESQLQALQFAEMLAQVCTSASAWQGW